MPNPHPSIIAEKITQVLKIPLEKKNKTKFIKLKTSKNRFRSAGEFNINKLINKAFPNLPIPLILLVIPYFNWNTYKR